MSCAYRLCLEVLLIQGKKFFLKNKICINEKIFNLYLFYYYESLLCFLSHCKEFFIVGNQNLIYFQKILNFY